MIQRLNRFLTLKHNPNNELIQVQPSSWTFVEACSGVGISFMEKLSNVMSHYSVKAQLPYDLKRK